MSYSTEISRVVCNEGLSSNVFAEFDTPYDFLARVVEGKSVFNVLLVNGILIRGLELFNKVFVSTCSESLSFFRVKENIVDDKERVSDLSSDLGSLFNNNKFTCRVEVNIDSDIVVL